MMLPGYYPSNTLTKNQLEALPTVRLLTLYKKIRNLYLRKYYDEDTRGRDMSRYKPYYKYVELVKSVLETREHIV